MIAASGSLAGELINQGMSPAAICSIFSTVDVSTEPIKMAMFVKRRSPLKKTFNVVSVNTNNIELCKPVDKNNQ